ncbi:hypothetical protein GQ53DRAFT_834296 [Thozetella sp. PMI_491]|nr:hypothetical protein GQ53DRAFT_834296 [Thozetella sp. PMI_491]
MHSIWRFVISFGLLAAASAGVIERSLVERIYLVSCGSTWSTSSWSTSQVGYYADNAGYEEAQDPTALGDFGHVVTWEGNTLTAPLDNGDLFTSQIVADATSKGLGAVVGNGTTTTESWVIRKRYSGSDPGAGGLAWYTSDGRICISLYEVATSEIIFRRLGSYNGL